MSSTRKKIIESSILLFNSKGLANVRLQDIAEYNKISPGNLTYHFKTKKDLMDYIIYVMIRKLVEIEAKQKKLLNTNFDLYQIFKNHLYFLISYRFFFRDILEIRRGDRDEMYNLFWQPPPPLVPGFIVTFSRILFLLPMIKLVFSPLYFKSCGSLPIAANG